MSEAPSHKEKVFRGIPVSPGVSRGRILLLAGERDEVPRWTLDEDETAREIHRLEDALVKTRRQILEVQRKVGEELGDGESGIFDAHLLAIEDPVLIGEVSRLIEEDRVNAEHAFQTAANKYISALSAVDDEFLRERVTDMKDIVARVLDNLMERADCNPLEGITDPVVVVSHDLTPSMTASMDKEKVLGFATDVGSKTSHTAILARSLKLPAVVGLHDASSRLQNGDEVLLDGFNGVLSVNPTEQTLFEYGLLVRRKASVEEELQRLRDEPAETKDGRRIVLSANLEHASDVALVRENGAEGCGLFRTEYLFIQRDSLPSEEEQFQEYHQVARALKPSPVIFRTLDLGGDKFLSHLHVPREMNPFLGWRAIRYCLQEKDVFRAQIRAILRASAEGNVKIMYPMISGLGELKAANALVEQCKQELNNEGIAFDTNIEIGAMMEIPSAVLVGEALGRRVKFFSVGTNDLIQYTLAVDRMNDRIAHLYEPTHPAIVRLIKMTVDAGGASGAWVGVCGEMAGDPEMVPLLIGLGVDELSVAAPYVPQIKHLVRNLDSNDARELAQFALKSECSAEILTRSQKLAKSIAPNLF